MLLFREIRRATACSRGCGRWTIACEQLCHRRVSAPERVIRRVACNTSRRHPTQSGECLADGAHQWEQSQSTRRLQFEVPDMVCRVRDRDHDGDAGAGVDGRRRRETGLGEGASWSYATTPVTVWENPVPSVVAPCITSISHRPGCGSGAMSEAFPVGLPSGWCRWL